MRPALIDTSTWIRFFRGDPATARLVRLLDEGYAYVHPWSIGELQLGSGLPDRHEAALLAAPGVPSVDDALATRFMHYHRLRAWGIGWVDLNLLAAAHERGIALWTFDGPLEEVARHVRLPELRW